MDGAVLQVCPWPAVSTSQPLTLSLPPAPPVPTHSGGGYCSEATSFALGLNKILPLLIDQHGDGYDFTYVSGMDYPTHQQLSKMHARQASPDKTVYVCHSEPGAWNPPRYATSVSVATGRLWVVVGS